MIRPLVCSTLALGLAACAMPNAGTSQPPSVTPSAPSTAAPSAAPVPQGFRLTGTVYDDDLATLPGVELSASRDGQVVATAQTGTTGAYSLEVPAGEYLVTAGKAGFTRRSRQVTVQGDTSLNFGGREAQGFQSAFLSTIPEVAEVKVTEEAPGKGLTFVLTMSEPLPDASQKNFTDRLEIRTADDKPFLSPVGTAGALVPQTVWDTLGRTLTVRYAGPYLATGPQVVGYTLKLRQQDLGTVNAATEEKDFEKLGITDAEGNPIAFDRADYLFYQPAGTDYLSFVLMADKTIAYTPRKRGWYLTHRGSHVHTAAQDTTAPAIKEIIPAPGTRLGSDTVDAVRVRFSEPMRVVRNADEKEYTRLKEDERFAEIATAGKADGSDAKRLDMSPIRFAIDAQDPTIVTLYYPANTLLDKRWVEIALTDKALDPAGNKPDTTANRMAATIK